MDGTCPKCQGRVQRTFVTVPAHSLDPIPRQTEPYVRITGWQCLRNSDHKGSYRTPSETGPPDFVPVKEWTDDEWLRALREFPPDTDYREVENKVAEWRR
jgi:hypothetical protein